MLEQKIQELIEALDRNTHALKMEPMTQTELPLKTETVKPTTPKPDPVKAELPAISVWRELAQKLLDTKQRAKIDEINKKHGLTRITEAHGTDKADAVFAELKAAADAQ